MVLVHDTSSQCALQMYEVSSNTFNGYQVVERTQFCDGQTDGQTDKCKLKTNVTLPQLEFLLGCPQMDSSYILLFM